MKFLALQLKVYYEIFSSSIIVTCIAIILNVMREAEGGVLKIVEGMEALERRPAGRPRKAWKMTVQHDLDMLKLRKKWT